MHGSQPVQVGSRRTLGTRRRGFDHRRRSKANPVMRRRDALLRQRHNGARGSPDPIMQIAQQLPAAKLELPKPETMLADEHSQQT